MTPLRIGSLCTGYGGLDMAVQAVFGGELAWTSDIDPGACKIIAHRHPAVPNLGDLTAVDWDQVEPVDIVTGGYPCQPFSLAGDLKGTEDERHIWPDIARALGVLRPRLAIFENVANHLRLGFDTVLCDLASIRFDAEWCLVRADEVGAAHQRKRLIFLAWPTDPESAGREGQGLLGPAAQRGVPAADSHNVGGDGDRACSGWRDEPTPRRFAHAHANSGGFSGHSELPTERDALRQRVGQDADGRNTPSADPASFGRGEGRAEPARQQGGPDAPIGGPPNWGEYAPAVARWERATGRTAPSPTNDLGRLNPPFVEWLMGLPAGHVTDVPGLSRTAQLKALGNGVVPQQAEAAIRLLAARASP